MKAQMVFYEKIRSEECGACGNGNKISSETENIENLIEQREKVNKRIFKQYRELVNYYRRQYTNE